jgi:hypothetical protein
MNRKIHDEPIMNVVWAFILIWARAFYDIRPFHREERAHHKPMHELFFFSKKIRLLWFVCVVNGPALVNDT